MKKIKNRIDIRETKTDRVDKKEKKKRYFATTK